MTHFGGNLTSQGWSLGASSDGHPTLQNKGCRLLARNCSDRASESLGQKNSPRRDMRMTGFIATDGFRSLLTFSLLISEDFWVFLPFPRDRNIFSTSVGGYKNTAIAEKRDEETRNPH